MIRLLIVDNDDRSLSALEGLFRTEGFTTFSTWSAREALELIRRQPFDVLLVSDYLPDLHYEEFLKRIGEQSTKHRVILMRTEKLPRKLGTNEVDKMDSGQIRQAVLTTSPISVSRKSRSTDVGRLRK